MSQQDRIVVYGFSLSGHSHRVALFLSLLGLSYEWVEVDLKKGAQKTPEFLSKNPFGQVPVIEDGRVTLSDSNAILVYLARRYDSQGRWLPAEPLEQARVEQWLAIAAGPLAYGPAAARRAKIFNAKLDYEQAVAAANDLFSVMERQLAQRPYLVGTQPTIADLSIYTYTALANEGGIELGDRREIGAWLRRIEALPRFLPFTQLGRNLRQG